MCVFLWNWMNEWTVSERCALQCALWAAAQSDRPAPNFMGIGKSSSSALGSKRYSSFVRIGRPAASSGGKRYSSFVRVGRPDAPPGNRTISQSFIEISNSETTLLVTRKACDFCRRTIQRLWFWFFSNSTRWTISVHGGAASSTCTLHRVAAATYPTYAGFPANATHAT